MEMVEIVIIIIFMGEGILEIFKLMGVIYIISGG